MKILILSSSFKSRATQHIKKEAEKRGHIVTVLDPKHLYLYISNSTLGYDKILDGYYKEVKSVFDRDFDAVIPRVTNTEYASYIIEHLTDNLKTYSTASSYGLRTASDKFSTQLVASVKGIKVPKTILFEGTRHINTLADKVGGFPLILKTRKGSQGIGVNLISDSNSLAPFIQTLNKYNPKLILQEYIKSSSDYRAIVIGNKVVASMKRTSASKNEFRANVSLGGIGESVELTSQEQEFCINAAQALNIDFAGVDFMKVDNKLYLIEVNGNSGFKIESITGVNIAKHLIEHIELRVNTPKDEMPAFNGTVPINCTEELMAISKELSRAKDALQFFNRNNVILNLFEKYNNENLEYVDSNGEEHSVLIKSVNDIYNIIINTVNFN